MNDALDRTCCRVRHDIRTIERPDHAPVDSLSSGRQSCHTGMRRETTSTLSSLFRMPKIEDHCLARLG
ncbi:hypothetical protein, partial [Thiocapsa sp.]|uniref:hypothetical protein n=1 Tax=Thiocapsa sp. TaxID=2024551 RepID=UPI002C571C8B